jgi:hypothetical protein
MLTVARVQFMQFELEKFPGLCPWHRFIDIVEKSCLTGFVLVRIDPL